MTIGCLMGVDPELQLPQIKQLSCSEYDALIPTSMAELPSGCRPTVLTLTSLMPSFAMPSLRSAYAFPAPFALPPGCPRMRPARNQGQGQGTGSCPAWSLGWGLGLRLRSGLGLGKCIST